MGALRLIALLFVVSVLFCCGCLHQTSQIEYPINLRSGDSLEVLFLAIPLSKEEEVCYGLVNAERRVFVSLARENQGYSYKLAFPKDTFFFRGNGVRSPYINIGSEDSKIKKSIALAVPWSGEDHIVYLTNTHQVSVWIEGKASTMLVTLERKPILTKANAVSLQ
ncbi:MAG: hypothetical protein PHN39_00135 [Candidatus Pacebacteria bacterium]|nr:hypothetical protein [Candidatus Paceibacterota bacterium]